MSGEAPLFDELLSPGTETKTIGDGEENGDEPHDKDDSSLQEGKSMENILLETSAMEESIDLSTGTVAIDVGGDLKEEINEDDQDLLASDDIIEENEPDTMQMDSAVQQRATKKEDGDLSSEPVMRSGDATEPLETRKSDICEYFQTPQKDSDTIDIFDSLAATTAEKLTVQEQDVTQNTDLSPENSHSSSKVHIRLESHSSISEDVTTVDFLEDKGEEPLKPTPSTRSLTKYFSTTDNEVGDDAKSFFETFTVGGSNANDGLPGSSSGYSGAEQPVAESGMSFPPETPPIPVGSPMPSPFHQISAPPSSGLEQHPFFPDQQDNPGKQQDNPSETQPQSAEQIPFVESGPDDPFTLGLNISDIDRRHDAWIPSESTRQVLIWVMTSQPGSVTLQSEQMTMPGLIQDEPLVCDVVMRI